MDLDEPTGEAPDSVGTYLREIGRTPLLTAEQEVEFARMIEAGLYAQHLLDHPGLVRPAGASEADLTTVANDGVAARQQMIEANLRLVVGMARRYLWSGMTLLDLMQEGNMGLVRAVEKFDYTRGFKFSTYAVNWVRQGVSRGVADSAKSVRIPIHRGEQHNRARVVTQRLASELGRPPTDDEVGAVLGIRPRVVAQYRLETQPVRSLDAQLSTEPDGARLGDLLPDPRAAVALSQVERDVDAEAVSVVLDEALQGLNERDRYVLRRRFGFGDMIPATLVEIGRELGLTRESIRKIESKALAALRTAGPVTALDVSVLDDSA